MIRDHSRRTPGTWLSSWPASRYRRQRSGDGDGSLFRCACFSVDLTRPEVPWWAKVSVPTREPSSERVPKRWVDSPHKRRETPDSRRAPSILRWLHVTRRRVLPGADGLHARGGAAGRGGPRTGG